MSPSPPRRTHARRHPLPGPRVLSVRQPWAWAIVSGLKPVENRSWSTRYRGTVLIHASATIDAWGIQWFEKERIAVPANLVRGAVVGSCELIEIVNRRQGRRFGKWFFGPVGWVVSNAREYAQPIAMKGSLGLFRPSPAILRGVSRLG